MNYDFPFIFSLDQVRQFLDDNFRITEQEGITYINYTNSSTEAFPEEKTVKAAIRRECRGIAFDRHGRLLSRPFHKFFNMNEREETSNLDLSQPHDILEKLDGSMVRPIHLEDGTVRWATKGGITDVSMKAEVFVAQHPEYNDFAKTMHGYGLTPIFEFTAPDNRIVLPYDRPSLTLLAIRHRAMGDYATYEGMEELAADFNIPVVKKVTLEFLQEEENKEGVVLVFASGMVKIKTDWYLKRHRAKELFDNERHLVQLMMEDDIDDVLPLVDPDSRQIVIAFQAQVFRNLNADIQALRRFYRESKSDFPTKKELALNGPDQPWKGWLFKLWDRPELTPEEVVFQSLKNHLHSNKKFKDYQQQFPYLKRKYNHE